MTETEQEVLKLCPFCGDKIYFPEVVFNESWNYWSVICHDCGAESENCYVHGNKDARQKAIDSWNTRSYEEELTHLRKQEQIWKKVCAYEKEKWLTWAQILPGSMSAAEKTHLRNLDELSKELAKE